MTADNVTDALEQARKNLLVRFHRTRLTEDVMVNANDLSLLLYPPAAPSVPSPVGSENDYGAPETITSQGSFAGAHTQPGAADGVVSDLLEALRRLGSSEAFDMPQAIDGPLAEETRQRLDFARAAYLKAETALQADADPLRWAAKEQLAYWRRGHAIIEGRLAKAAAAKHEDAPFPLDATEAANWHAAQADAYRDALEMMGVPECCRCSDPAALPPAEVKAETGR